MFGLLAGPIVAVLVSILKRIPWVASFPKVAAAILSTLAAVVGVVSHGGLTGNIVDVLNQLAHELGTIATAALVTQSIAVNTHETILAPIAKLAPPAAPPMAPPSAGSPLQGGR